MHLSRCDNANCFLEKYLFWNSDSTPEFSPVLILHEVTLLQRFNTDEQLVLLI